MFPNRLSSRKYLELAGIKGARNVTISFYLTCLTLFHRLPIVLKAGLAREYLIWRIQQNNDLTK